MAYCRSPLLYHAIHHLQAGGSPWMCTPDIRLALPHTLAGTLGGSLWPFSCWSINHIPTTNSSRVRRPICCPSTKSHTCARTCRGRRLRDQMSAATRLTTISEDSGGYASGTLKCAGGSNNPLFAAQTPSYRFRSFSVISLRHLLRSPS